MRRNWATRELLWAPKLQLGVSIFEVLEVSWVMEGIQGTYPFPTEKNPFQTIHLSMALGSPDPWVPGADGRKATYLVHDNGGRPFKISVQRQPGDPKAQVQVFKAIYDEEMPRYEREPCISFSAERVFVGQSPKHAKHRARFDGNSLLLHLEGLKYVFVGENVFAFTAKSPITKYVSPVGNSDVPYPWAMDEQGFRYLMISSVIVTGKLFENSDTDPYDLFFDRAVMTADIGMVPPKQPFHAQFQGITEFWIGENQYTFRYEPHPEKDFDRLSQRGELYVVKGSEKIKLSKDDYVKLMQDFADLAGFETLHSETLVERHIWPIWPVVVIENDCAALLF